MRAAGVSDNTLPIRGLRVHWRALGPYADRRGKQWSQHGRDHRQPESRLCGREARRVSSHHPTIAG